MEKIKFMPESIWHYAKHVDKASNIEIAENDEFGILICMSIDKGIPTVSVYADSHLEEERTLKTQSECEDNIKEIYEYYLTGRFITVSEDDFEDYETSEAAYLDEIERREDELDEGVLLFLAQVFPDGFPEEMIEDFDADVEEIKEAFLSFLAFKKCWAIYRPTIVEDSKTGDENFVDYPYELVDANPAKEDAKDEEDEDEESFATALTVVK